MSRKIILKVLGVLLSANGAAGWGQQYVISTIAGGGPPATPIAALDVSFNSPLSVAVDAAGNVYLSSLNCVFRIDPKGVLTRVAGNSRAGFSGDGGPARNAQLNNPLGIAVDSAGNVFIADSTNNRIRKVSSDGIITTVAGDGTPGSSGDGGPAITAQLLVPGGVAVDGAGNLFFAQGGRSMTETGGIRKVSPDGIITTVAVTSSQAVFYSRSLAADKAGNLFIADAVNGRVRKLSSDGMITVVAGNGSQGYSGDGGPAINAQLFNPNAVALDSLGNLFIADYANQRIRKVDSGGTITTVAGTGQGLFEGPGGYSGDGGPAIAAQLNGPSGVAADGAGNLFIADTFNSRIRKISSSGTISTVAGNGFYSYSGDGGPATGAQLYNPTGVAVDRSGNVFIADALNNRVRKLSSSGVITTVAGNGPPCPAFPGTLVPPPVPSCGAYSGNEGSATSTQLNSPGGVAVDSAGNLFIADFGNKRIRKVSPDGIISTVAGTEGVLSPLVVVDTAGDLFFADLGNGRVLKLSPDGTITAIAGSSACDPDYICSSGDGGPATDAQLTGPVGLAVDKAGNVFISDAGRIRKVSLDGIITTVAGCSPVCTSGLGDGGPAPSAHINPYGIAVDSAGNLFIADSGNNRVRKVSPDGIITTVAGDGGCAFSFPGICFSGDGGPATNAELNQPSAVAVDGAGNLYVADTGNGAVRLLQPIGPPLSPALTVNGAASAASNLAGAVSPGEIVVLHGSGLGPAQLTPLQLAAGKVATTLAGTQVLFNGISGPIVYTSSTQVAAIVPYETDGATVQVQVSYQGQTSEPLTVQLAASVPAIFSRDSTGKGQAAAINQDSSVNGTAHPAPIGSVISLYVTGEGQTSPAGIDGQIAGAASPQPLSAVSVTIGGIPATVQYAGGVPGEVAGIMQVNVQIPPEVQPGSAVPVMLTVGNASSQPGITISVSDSDSRASTPATCTSKNFWNWTGWFRGSGRPR